MNFQSICRLPVSGVSTWRSQSAHGGNYRLQVHAGGAERRLQRSARRFLFRSEGCLFCAASVSGYVLKQTRLTPSKFSHHFPCSQTYNSPHLELIDARSRWSCWLVGRVFRATWARRSGARHATFARAEGKERSGCTGNSKQGMEITKGSGISAEAKTTILDYRLHLLDRETVWKRLILEVRSRIEPQWLLW